MDKQTTPADPDSSSPTCFVHISSYSVHPVNGNVEYIIHVGKSGSIVRRRFREFWKLHENLSAYWADLPELPSRVFNTAPTARMPKLNDFLAEVCEALGSRPPKELLSFLDVDEAAFAQARTSSLQGMAASASIKVDYGTPKCPEQYRNEIERVIQEIMDIKQAQDGVKGWKLVGHRLPFSWLARPNDPDLGYKQCRVAYGELKRCPPRTVHDLILDNDACKEMEPKLDSIRDVAKLDEQTFVQFFIMKSIMFMPPRDVIMLRHWRVLPDGSILHAEFSLDEYPGVPASGTEGRVRAKLTVGGLIIEPIPGDPTSCKIWRINDMDPMLGDAIPAYALAKLNEFTASMLSNNMFSLEKLVNKCQLNRELAKGPLVNWNGKVEGPSADEKQLATAAFVDAEPRPKYALEDAVKGAAPYIIGFTLGFSAALVAFVASPATN